MRVNIIDTKIEIPRSLFPTICRHLRTSTFLDPRNMGGGRYGKDGREESWFSGVNMLELKKHLEADDLPAVLAEFGFEVSLQVSTGSIIDLMYDNKRGDEGILFDYIAEVLPRKHTVTWSDNDGDFYQWQISNKQLRSVDGVVTFPKPRSKKRRTK